MFNFHNNNNSKYYIYTKNQFINLSIYLGHSKVKWNKVFKFFVFYYRNNFIIFKYDYLIYSLKRCLNFIRLVLLKHGKLFFLSNFINKGINSLNKYLLERFLTFNYHSYYDGFYIGGLLSNIVSLYRTKQKKKKLKFIFSKKNLKRQIPSIIIISSLNSFFFVLKEATNIGLPSIALIDSDLMYKDCLYPIIGNNDSVIINFYFNLLFFLQIKLTHRLKKFNYLIYYFKFFKYLLKFYIVYKFIYNYLYLKKNKSKKFIYKNLRKKINCDKNILIIYGYEILSNYFFNINKVLLYSLYDFRIKDEELINNFLFKFKYNYCLNVEFNEKFENEYKFFFTSIIFKKIFFFKKFLFIFLLKKLRLKYTFNEHSIRLRERYIISKYFKKYFKVIRCFLKKLIFKKFIGFLSFKQKLINYFLKKKKFLKKKFNFNYYFFKKTSFFLKLFTVFKRIKKKQRKKVKKKIFLYFFKKRSLFKKYIHYKMSIIRLKNYLNEFYFMFLKNESNFLNYSIMDSTDGFYKKLNLSYTRLFKFLKNNETSNFFLEKNNIRKFYSLCIENIKIRKTYLICIKLFKLLISRKFFGKLIFFKKKIKRIKKLYKFYKYLIFKFKKKIVFFKFRKLLKGGKINILLRFFYKLLFTYSSKYIKPFLHFFWRKVKIRNKLFVFKVFRQFRFEMENLLYLKTRIKKIKFFYLLKKKKKKLKMLFFLKKYIGLLFKYYKGKYYMYIFQKIIKFDFFVKYKIGYNYKINKYKLASYISKFFYFIVFLKKSIVYKSFNKFKLTNKSRKKYNNKYYLLFCLYLFKNLKVYRFYNNVVRYLRKLLYFFSSKKFVFFVFNYVNLFFDSIINLDIDSYREELMKQQFVQFNLKNKLYNLFLSRKMNLKRKKINYKSHILNFNFVNFDYSNFRNWLKKIRLKYFRNKKLLKNTFLHNYYRSNSNYFFNKKLKKYVVKKIHKYKFFKYPNYFLLNLYNKIYKNIIYFRNGRFKVPVHFKLYNALRTYKLSIDSLLDYKLNLKKKKKK